ncbi:MAG: ribonuclease III [Lachnospiraceae bacterium]|nr:ribonuclease III [Lachnospiraceae bacterium]
MVADEKITELEGRIGYTFHDRELLKLALTHSSYSNELKINRYGNYERLEFLGDAVLELMSSQFFYKEYPEMSEGELTRLRSSIVCEMALASCARQIGLQDYILLGKGEEGTGGRARDSIISDVLEAVLGALYLDGGFDTANEFVLKYVLTDLDHKKLFYDAKTILQELMQKEGKELVYELVGESGPDHDKRFRVSAVVDGTTEGTGEGKSKKAAEQMAAYEVLLKENK